MRSYKLFLSISLIILFTTILIGTDEVKDMDEIRSITLITKVFVNGERIFAIAIEYPTEIENTVLSPEYFSVKVKKGENYFSRSITKVYVNTLPKASQSIFISQGKFVILELNPDDFYPSKEHSETVAPSGFFLNKREDPEYIVSQTAPIVDVNGQEIPPFSRKKTREIRLGIDDFQAFIFKDSENDIEIPYRLFVPENVNPNKKYPLVVFLHGAGARGTDNITQLAENRGAIVWAEPKVQAVHPCFVLAPQCPSDSSWSTLFTDNNDPYKPEKPLLAVINLIKKLLKEHNIDEKRVYITGLSMGGYGTWTAIINFPELFAAAIPICGGGDVSKVEKVKNIPIWVVHAEDDPVVPVENSRTLVRKLSEIGGKIKYTEYEKGYIESLGWGDGHGSWKPAYEDQRIIEWLFEQRKGD